RRADDGATTRIAVQEALAGPDYPNVGSNARGTGAIFEIAPDGEIGAATSTDYDAEPMVGWNRDDPGPAVGRLGRRRGLGAVADLACAPAAVTGVATSPADDAAPMVGWNRGDPAPAVGSLDSRRGIAAVALDYAYRTIGLDLIRPRETEAVVLIGTEAFAPDG